MRKTWIIIIISIILAFAIIQFFQPAKNTVKASTTSDIVFHLQIPSNVKKIIVNACYDCHSNNTHYPLYANVAPISWLLNSDIKKAKKKMNFSEWGQYDKKEQLKLLTDICDELTQGEMPLKSYVFMHSNAKLNPDQVDEICKWTEDAGEEVLSK